jgi:5-methylcytosine-specific restriction endonuclease McrA
LSGWDNYSIIEVVKESSELPFTDASNLILAGRKHSNYTTVSYPLPPTYGGFIMPDNSPKQCTKCLDFFDLSNFYKSKSHKGGYQTWCKPCFKDNANKNYRANKEGKKEYQKRHYLANRKTIIANQLKKDATRKKEKALYNREYRERNLEALNIATKAYREAHKGEVSESRRLWLIKNAANLSKKARERYQENIERMREVKRVYRKKNKEKTNTWWQRRRARKIGGGGSHTVEEWIFVKEVNGNRCVKCGRKEPEIKLTKDHIVPLALGGSDSIGNLQPLCLSCNCSKQAKFEDYRGRRLVRGKLRKSD